MILDAAMQFSDSQAVTATAVGTNVVDLGVAQRQRGHILHVVFNVTEAATASGAATVDFEVVTDDNDSLSSPTVVASSGAIGKATLVAGHQLSVQLPVGVPLERYLGVQYTVATGPLTAGQFDANVTNDLQNDYYFADADIANA